jgi:hypothetical protein
VKAFGRFKESRRPGGDSKRVPPEYSSEAVIVKPVEYITIAVNAYYIS